MKENISFNLLSKLDIRICLIKDAKKIEGKDKLLVLTLETPYDVRQAVTNIGQYFNVDQLIGKKYPFILNLEPTVIAKVESYAMIICNSNENDIELFESNLPVGSIII